ncbi:hypothetical protein KC336_g19629 [Hortaea werneckii]|nr:hypothetical protein KC336_g19629 [Hortaea werneckii]
MKDQLKVMNTNRTKLTGDKHTPRKKAAGGAPAAGVSNAALVEEVQGLRRAVQALVQGAKVVMAAHGLDTAPAPSSSSSGDEQETPSGGASAQQKASLAAKRKREQRR